MPKLIILRGNSGSGKTTVAKALQRRFGRGTLLISQDTVRREMLFAKGDDDPPCLPLLEALLEYGHARSDVVILEGILSARKYKPLFEKAGELFGTEVFAYYYDLPFEETLRRHATKPCRDQFGEAEMRDWWLGKDLSDALSETVITAEADAESTVENIYSAVISR